MNILIIVIDCLILLTCIAAAYFSYRLWLLLGKHGITSWLTLAMVYAIFLRIVSLLSDCGEDWGFISYTRVIAFPMYAFLLFGLWGLLKQVSEKLNNDHKPPEFKAWLAKVFCKKVGK
jgi:TRAP-type C4-dicarboxylate transport system permease small subunit